MNSKDITIILPIHDVKGNFEEWFDKSIKSISQSLVKPNIQNLFLISGHLLLKYNQKLFIITIKVIFVVKLI